MELSEVSNEELIEELQRRLLCRDNGECAYCDGTGEVKFDCGFVTSVCLNCEGTGYDAA